MSALEKPFYTPEQYLEREREAVGKSEYYGGQIFVRESGTGTHGTAVGNVQALLWLQTREHASIVFNCDMRVLVEATGFFTYPDVSVVRGQAQFMDEARDVLVNPAMIVEVMSPSTQDYDRGEKFAQYQRLDSLTDYLIVSQDVMRVEHFVRQGDDQWLLSVYHGLEAVVKIASIGCDLRLSEVYWNVKISPERNPLTLRRIS